MSSPQRATKTAKVGQRPRVWLVSLGCGHEAVRPAGAGCHPLVPGSPAHCFVEGCGADTHVVDRERGE